MKILKVLFAAALLVVSAAAASSQSYGNYTIRHDGIFYQGRLISVADPATFRDLGFGYAKDRQYVYMYGQVLPYVEPASFKVSGSHGLTPSMPGTAGRPPVIHAPGSRPDGNGRGYKIVGHSVFYDGHPIKSVHAQSFKDLGWGYAKDSFKIYYCGRELRVLMDSSFRVLDDGYAKDAFEVFFMGEKLEGADVRTFRSLKNGYAKDSFNIYYMGAKIGKI